MERHDHRQRAALLAAQEAIKSAERLAKTTSPYIYESEEEFQEKLKARGINPDATKNPAVKVFNEMLGLWPINKSIITFEQLEEYGRKMDKEDPGWRERQRAQITKDWLEDGIPQDKIDAWFDDVERQRQQRNLGMPKVDKIKRPKIAAVDMDGTILESDGTAELGKPIKGVKKKLDRLKALGWVIVIWTVREETPEILAHLKKYEIPFDYFNWHPWQPKGAGVKIRADVYIDDRAVTFKGDPKDFDQVLVHRPWWK